MEIRTEYYGMGDKPYDTYEQAKDRIRRMKASDEETDFSIRWKMGKEPKYQMEYDVDTERTPGKFWVVKKYIPR